MKNIIACPLKPEYLFLKEALNEKSSTEKNLGSLKFIELPNLNSILMVAGHGKVQFAISCTTALNYFSNAKTIFCAGTGGALIKELNPGDVIVGTQTIEHDFKQFATNNNLPYFNGSEEHLTKAKNFVSSNFRVTQGPIASGDEDILTETRAFEIHSSTKALITAWEGAGGARVAKAFNRNFLEIRGVSDFSDSNTKTDFKKNINLAMINISALLRHLLR